MVFFFHYFLATLMNNRAKLFTSLFVIGGSQCFVNYFVQRVPFLKMIRKNSWDDIFHLHLNLEIQGKLC